jgi:hypothetical protein
LDTAVACPHGAGTPTLRRLGGGVNGGVDGTAAQPYYTGMEQTPVRFELRLTQEQWTAINEWRRRQPDLPSKIAAVRRLLDLGLRAEAEPPARTAPKARR